MFNLIKVAFGRKEKRHSVANLAGFENLEVTKAEAWWK